MLTFPLRVSVQFPDRGKRLSAGEDAPRRQFGVGGGAGGLIL